MTIDPSSFGVGFVSGIIVLVAVMGVVFVSQEGGE